MEKKPDMQMPCLEGFCFLLPSCQDMNLNERFHVSTISPFLAKETQYIDFLTKTRMNLVCRDDQLSH